MARGKFSFLLFCVFVVLIVANEYQYLTEEEKSMLQVLRKEKETEVELTQLKQGKRMLCPNNCNGHGTCNTGKGICQCASQWAGDDCSYQVIPLTSNSPLRGQQVSSQRWIFYTIATSGGGLLVVVNQTSILGDADMYMLQGDFPSRTKYTQRNIEVDKNFYIQVDNAGTGTWYIGIYGFSNAIFTLTAVTTGACADLNNCNYPNGVCTAPHVCTCNSTWAGADCSERANTIVQNRVYTGSVSWMSWVFYQLRITSSNTFRVSLNQTNESADLDLYVRHEEQPDQFDYDYSDSSSDTNVELVVDNPQQGVWWIGIYGYTSGSYSLMVTGAVRCPNECSAHGTCRGVTCSCNSAYRGSACEFMVSDLQDAVPVSGYVSDNTWNYYHMKPSSQNNVIISVQQSGNVANQDCDLYVKSGTQPSKFDYDYSHTSTDQNFTLTIEDPSDETWYFGVYGYTTCTYTLTASLTVRCPGNCSNHEHSNHGQCVNGLCVCYPGYSGVDCNTTMVSLVSGAAPLAGVVNLNNAWSFYSINIVNTTYLAIEVKEKKSQGFLWVYASKGRQPDTRNYDEADKETNSKFHRIHIEFPNPTTEQWVIGVYYNPFAVNNVTYQIAAWYPPF